MTTNSGRSPAHNGIDPLVEALIKELLGGASPPKGTSRTEDAITAALAEELIASLVPTRAAGQAPSLETTLLAAALAPALADALAPALAEALTPAIIKALNSLASSKEPVQPTPKEGPDRRKKE